MNNRRELLLLIGAGVTPTSGCSSSSDSESTQTETSTEESTSADFGSFTTTVDSRATFLRQDSSDSANPDPEMVNLENRGVSTGDRVEFVVSGLWASDDDEYGNPDNWRSIGPLGRSGELSGIEKLNRVPGAIDAGEDIENADTYESDKPTAIPEDFEISRRGDTQCVRQNVIAVPREAECLFIRILDSAYHDNRGKLTIEIGPAQS